MARRFLNELSARKRLIEILLSPKCLPGDTADILIGHTPSSDQQAVQALLDMAAQVALYIVTVDSAAVHPRVAIDLVVMNDDTDGGPRLVYAVMAAVTKRSTSRTSARPPARS